MTEQEIAAMTSEEWDAFTKTLPCAVIDFRNCGPTDDDEDAQEEMHPLQKPD